MADEDRTLIYAGEKYKLAEGAENPIEYWNGSPTVKEVELASGARVQITLGPGIPILVITAGERKPRSPGVVL